ncbi:MAG: glycine cleavage system aminomethyltransferase GcvT [Thermodesulfobacteriota bacterium]
MRRTPLHEQHRAAGARFTEFGGWEMPVQYMGILAEHALVRSSAGLFDVSHMGEIEVRGPKALDLCQRVATNDASRLAVGEAQYTLWCDESGGTIDDTILYRTGDERFMFCVNAGNAEICRDWMVEQQRHVPGALVVDMSADLALLALQGPRASEVLRRAGADAGLLALPRFGCTQATVAGVRVFGARTGYTGEDGFELFTPQTSAVSLWQALLGVASDDLPVGPIGLGARDTLRLEAALPLYGHELARDVSPLEAGLGWAVKLDKAQFIGRDALVEQKRRGVARQLVGLELRGAGIARADYPVLASGTHVGRCTSGTKSPTLGKAIALAFVARESLDAALSVEIRGRAVAAERVRLPFYRRPATPAN